MKTNTILILMDELIHWKNLPKSILKKLKGYNAFKKISIQFDNIHCNRTVCSPSRSSIISGIINHGVQDNIDNNFQYDYIPRLDENLNTIAKICKKKKYDYTAYYGKQHFDSGLASNVFTTPMINSNSRQYMKKYGFDIYSSYGDTFYYPNQGIFGDLYNFEMITSENNPDYDWKDEKTGNKYVGLIPFLKARVSDCKSYYCEFHLVNPHDTQHMIQNYSQLPNNTQLQFWAPFIKEQFNEYRQENTLKINEFPYVPNKNLTENYFEKTYSKYKTEKNSLIFKESYELDYVSNSKTNSIFPYFVCSQQSYVRNFTFPDNETDIKSWKNLINNYYGLIIEADTYLYKIYKFMEENNMFENTNIIITSDHGDLMSAHGLKQKSFHFKESINVPLMIYSPNLEKSLRGSINNYLGNSIDIYPTILTMLKLKSNCKKIIGKSLLKWKNNKLKFTKLDSDVFHITNGFMFTMTGILFNQWYNSQSIEIQNKTIYKPKNIFDFISQFVMLITNYNGIQYKFIRYFNILEIIRYNFLYNEKYKKNNNQIVFTVELLDQFIDNSLIEKYPEIINNFKTILQDNFSEGFTFEQAYNLLLSNDIQLFLLITIIFTYFYKNNMSQIIIPGFFNSYDQLVSNSNYAFFCYNMSKDPNEIINLADPNYPSRHDIKLFNYLNNKLNENITNFKCDNFIYIFPYKSIITLLLILLKINKNISELNNQQLELFLNIGFNNNFDSSYGTSTIITKLLDFAIDRS